MLWLLNWLFSPAKTKAPSEIDLYWLQAGMQHFDNGEFDQAIAAYDKLLLAQPRHTTILVKRAEAYLEKADFEKAWDGCEAALAIDPHFAPAYYFQARIAQIAGQPERAIMLLADCLRADPTFYPAHVECGMCLHNLGQLQEALGHYNRATELRPFSGSAYYRRAMIWLAFEQFDRALSDLDASLQFDPEWVWALAHRASVRLLHDDYAGCIADYAELLRRAPEIADADVFNNLASAHYLCGDFAHALAYQTIAVEMAPAELKESFSVQLRTIEAKLA